MTETIYAEEFVTRFENLASKNFEAPEEEHKQLETLGKTLLREGYNSSKKPKNASYGLWDDMKFYLMELSQTEVNNKDLMILGFLPSMLMVHEGNINGLKLDLSKKDDVRNILVRMFEHLDLVDLNVSNLIVTHEQLSLVSPTQMYELFTAVKSNTPLFDSLGNEPLNIAENSTNIFYLPFIITISSQVPEDWHFSDIFNVSGLGMLTVEEIDTFWEFYNPQSDLDYDANLQTGKPGVFIDVIEDSETDRDLANIEMGLTDIRDYLSSNTASLNLNMSMEVFWPVNAGNIIPRDATPILRLSIMLQKEANSEVERRVYKIHVPKFAGDEWQLVLTRTLTLCYELGFTYVQVIQAPANSLLTTWQTIHESGVIH